MRLKTRGALAALPLVLALSLTGCGGDEQDGGVASAGGGGQGGSGATAAASLSPQERGLKFAQCMRKNGVPMEDPVDGKIQLKADRRLPKETMQKAQEACRQYSPQANRDPKQAAAMEERGRKHAECMRKNGVEKFPDPQPGQGGMIRIQGEVAQDPDLQTAQKACQDVLGGKGGPGGAPGGPGGDGQ
jgi:hypothetical protein